MLFHRLLGTPYATGRETFKDILFNLCSDSRIYHLDLGKGAYLEEGGEHWHQCTLSILILPFGHERTDQWRATLQANCPESHIEDISHQSS